MLGLFVFCWFYFWWSEASFQTSYTVSLSFSFLFFPCRRYKHSHSSTLEMGAGKEEHIMLKVHYMYSQQNACLVLTLVTLVLVRFSCLPKSQVLTQLMETSIKNVITNSVNWSSRHNQSKYLLNVINNSINWSSRHTQYRHNQSKHPLNVINNPTQIPSIIITINWSSRQTQSINTSMNHGHQ